MKSANFCWYEDAMHQGQQEDMICWEELNEPTPQVALNTIQVEPVYQWPVLTTQQLIQCSPFAFSYNSLKEMLQNEQFLRDMKQFISPSFPALTDVQATTPSEFMMNKFYQQTIELLECGFQMSFCGQKLLQMKQMLQEQDLVVEMLVDSYEKINKANINHLHLSINRFPSDKKHQERFINDLYQKYVAPFIQRRNKLKFWPKDNFSIAHRVFKAYQAKSYAKWTFEQYQVLYKKAKGLYDSGRLTQRDDLLSDFCFEKGKMFQIDNTLMKLHKGVFAITQEAINKHLHNTKLIYELIKMHGKIKQDTKTMREEVRLFFASLDQKGKSSLERELECEKQLNAFLAQLVRLKDT